MENGVSPRNNGFPAGLRVLVVDDDQVWLKVLERMLMKCSYEVTTCSLARDALEMLRKKRDGFDIVISDVNMPDMDGFKLLEHVGLEMNLPVIMMSVDGETSRVMKGVQHGACDYLLKPVRMKELQNIWQHVFRKKIHKPKNGDGHESNDDTDKVRNGLDELDDGHFINGGDLSLTKKRKGNENHEQDDLDTSDPSIAKKARIVWSVDLHQKFLDALNQIGFDSKVGPKKILDLMNVPWLKRENVASHLQKYRLYLSRLQKQNEPEASFCAEKQSDIIFKDPPATFDLHESMTKQQNQAASYGFRYSGSEMLVQNMAPEIVEDNVDSMVSFLPATNCKKALTGDVPCSQKLSGGSRTGLTNTFGSPEIDGNYTSFRSTVQQPQAWVREIPMLQFMQQPKDEQDVHRYTHLPLLSPQHQIQADCPLYASSIDPGGTSIRETHNVDTSGIQSLWIECRSSFVNNKHPTASATDLFSVQVREDTSNLKVSGDMSTTNWSTNLKNHSLDQHCISSLESFQPDLNFIMESGKKSLVSLQEDPQCHPLQDYACVNLGVLDFPVMELDTELPSHLYDELWSDSDYSYD